jgi:Ca2+-binding RTX toxin-like protein
MQSTTNTNGNNQGMPSVLPTVTSFGNPTFSGNSAADDAGTSTNNDNVYGTINITSLNTPPVANPDSVSATPNTPTNISVNTLLANDTDANDDSLTLTAVSNFTGGTAVLNDNGTPSSSADDYITFTPTTGFSDNASFDYSISDGNGGTSSATVTVAVGTVQNGGNGPDTLTGNAGNDILIGGNGRDTLVGNAGNDTLIGGNGTDLFFGNAGDDLLNGDNGDDTLTGGLDNDTLTGGYGNDVFVFASGDGTDTITDFKLRKDKIGLADGLMFENLSFSGNQIIFGTEVLVVLTGVNTNTLTATNFVTA